MQWIRTDQVPAHPSWSQARVHTRIQQRAVGSPFATSQPHVLDIPPNLACIANVPHAKGEALDADCVHRVQHIALASGHLPMVPCIEGEVGVMAQAKRNPRWEHSPSQALRTTCVVMTTMNCVDGLLHLDITQAHKARFAGALKPGQIHQHLLPLPHTTAAAATVAPPPPIDRQLRALQSTLGRSFL